MTIAIFMTLHSIFKKRAQVTGLKTLNFASQLENKGGTLGQWSSSVKLRDVLPFITSFPM